MVIDCSWIMIDGLIKWFKWFIEKVKQLKKAIYRSLHTKSHKEERKGLKLKITINLSEIKT